MEKVSLAFLLKNLDPLKWYINSKGEPPTDTDNGIIFQAILLRMQDIATIAAAANISEDDALREIEQAESEAIELNTADKDLVMPPDVQAALNCLIVKFLTQTESKAGDGSISGVLNLSKQTIATPVNSAIGDDLNLSGLTPVNTAGQLATTYATADTDGSSSASFWDILDKASASIANVAKSIQTIGGSVSGTVLGVSNAVQTVGANTGASAISLWLQRNGIILLVGILVFVLLIILLVRATKSK
jgi:hypothetical protein